MLTRRAMLLGTFAVGTAATLAACGSSDTTDNTESSADGLPANGSHAGLDSFKAAIATDGVQLVDIRTQEEYDSGHIDGAVLIDFYQENFLTRMTEELNLSAPCAIYCRSGNRSGQALQLLQEAGFEQVFDLDGGINTWSAAGEPLV